MAANSATRTSDIPIIDLTTPSASPQPSRGPVFMFFSRSGTLFRSAIVSPLRSSTIQSSNVSLLRTQREDPEVVVLELFSAVEGLAETNRISENAQQK